MFDENVSQLIIRGNKKYIITGDGYLATKKKKKRWWLCSWKTSLCQFKLHLTCHNEVVWHIHKRKKWGFKICRSHWLWGSVAHTREGERELGLNYFLLISYYFLVLLANCSSCGLQLWSFHRRPKNSWDLHIYFSRVIGKLCFLWPATLVLSQ